MLAFAQESGGSRRWIRLDARPRFFPGVSDVRGLGTSSARQRRGSFRHRNVTGPVTRGGDDGGRSRRALNASAASPSPRDCSLFVATLAGVGFLGRTRRRRAGGEGIAGAPYRVSRRPDPNIASLCHRLKNGFSGRRHGVGLHFLVPPAFRILARIVTAKKMAVLRGATEDLFAPILSAVDFLSSPFSFLLAAQRTGRRGPRLGILRLPYPRAGGLGRCGQGRYGNHLLPFPHYAPGW